MRNSLAARVLVAALLISAGPLAFYLASAQAVVRLQPSNSTPARPGAAPQPPDAVPEIEPFPDERARIAELIEQLGSPRMAQRDRAMGEIALYEGKALGQVRAAMQHDDDEIAWRCELLEEVIQSRQGELFLSARAMQMSIAELNGYLSSNDLTPLLSILKSRGRPGMSAVWARVLARVSVENRLFPVAQMCREIEGDEGYGIALARCAQVHAMPNNYRNLLLACLLLPPAEPAHTLETLIRLRFAEAGNTTALEAVLSAGEDFRALYAADAVLAARLAPPLPGAAPPDGADELRLALALEMASRVTADELAAANLPPAEQMSPLVLSAWLALLARSGLVRQLEGTLLSLIAGGGNARLAAAALAAVAPVADVIEVFDTLPPAAQLAVLDTWWAHPKEPQALHAFLLRLADSESATLAAEAVYALGQYRSHSTVRKLVAALPRFPDIALEALLPMADLLPAADPKGLAQLAAAFATAAPGQRPLLARLLTECGDKPAADAVVASWRIDLPAAELPLAVAHFAKDSATPVGAWCAASTAAYGAGSPQPPLPFGMTGTPSRVGGAAHHTMLALLLAKDAAQGFALLRAVATDAADSHRQLACVALALAGRDADLVDDWLKRLAGEVPDPRAAELGLAVAASATPAAQQYRRDALQQGLRAPGFVWVLQSFHMGRCPELDVADLYRVIAETPETARPYIHAWRWEHLPPPPAAVRNLVTAQLMAAPTGISHPVQALWIAHSGVDVLDLLYGSMQSPAPADAGQALTTALFGDRERARNILAAARPRDDGADWTALRVARAWTGMLGEPEDSRLAAAVAGDPARSWGAVRAASLADGGDVAALRRLLDRLGPYPNRMATNGTASVIVSERRWGQSTVTMEGAGHAFARGDATPELPASIVARWLPAPPRNWADWWRCRRGLLQQADGKFVFKELP
ncbi:MAG: hypothetical protein KF696_11925 [Planctomycetes bacterium]|nr:hypothetical protein [Planctomycetota bacterium]MCW8136996.1 hypothetical protein [Planctomycetota bacterium]